MTLPPDEASGSSTSPLPVRTRPTSLSATSIIASSLRRKRSVRQSLASSTQARISWPGYWSSLASSRSNRVKASAWTPAKPPITSPLARRRPCLRVALDDRLADRHLPVAADDRPAVLAHHDDRGAVPGRERGVWVSHRDLGRSYGLHLWSSDRRRKSAACPSKPPRSLPPPKASGADVSARRWLASAAWRDQPSATARGRSRRPYLVEGLSHCGECRDRRRFRRRDVCRWCHRTAGKIIRRRCARWSFFVPLARSPCSPWSSSFDVMSSAIVPRRDKGNRDQGQRRP